MQVNFSCELEDVKARKDHTLAIKLSTQELDPEVTALIFDMFNKALYIGIDESPIGKLELPDEAVEFADEKSPSKRFKHRLFVYWKSKYASKGDFESWYRATLEQLGQTYLDKME